VAIWSVEITPAVAAKVALPIRTHGDRRRHGQCSRVAGERDGPPPVPDRLTVQVLDPPAPKVDGAHASEVTVTALTSAMEAV